MAEQSMTVSVVDIRSLRMHEEEELEHNNEPMGPGGLTPRFAP